MSYIEGKTLSTLVGPNKPIAERTVAQLIRKLATTLQEAHDRGIIHRDLKPANVMIDRRREPVLMDFGLARTYSAETDSDGNRLTAEGVIVGSPEYMSPEQVRDQALGPATDIYSLGAVMYELFGLARPHTGDSAYEVLASVIKDEPSPLSKQHHKGQGTVPIEIDYICRRAMTKDPNNRFTSAAAMKEDLQLFLDGKYPIVCPHTALKRGSTALSHLIDNHAKGVILGLFALIFIAIFGVIAILMLTSG
jgi:serine/threonine-protein kinase